MIEFAKERTIMNIKKWQSSPNDEIVYQGKCLSLCEKCHGTKEYKVIYGGLRHNDPIYIQVNCDESYEERY